MLLPRIQTIRPAVQAEGLQAEEFDMGFGLPSHIDQGVLFGALGIWHLENTLRSFVKSPRHFTYRTWFPVGLPGLLRCLELWVLLLVILAFLFTQVSHVGADLAAGMILAHHLQRFQHITFGLCFLVYAIVGLVSEGCGRLPLPEGALHANLALGFLMELLVFHLGHHPGDTLESFVHMLMQIILACLVLAMFLEILWPQSFLVSLARCMLLVFKGSWFFHIGLLINVPAATPVGCSRETSDFPVCPPDGEAYMRAKSLQVLIFGCHILAILVSSYIAYASLVRFHVGLVLKDHYQHLSSDEDDESQNDNILETKDGGVVGPVISVVPDLRSFSRRRSYKARATP